MIYQVSSLTHANIISKVACHFLVELIIRLLKQIALELHMMPYVVNLPNITQKTRYNLRLQIFSQERYFLCQHQVLSRLGM